MSYQQILGYCLGTLYSLIDGQRKFHDMQRKLKAQQIWFIRRQHFIESERFQVETDHLLRPLLPTVPQRSAHAH